MIVSRHASSAAFRDSRAEDDGGALVGETAAVGFTFVLFGFFFDGLVLSVLLSVDLTEFGTVVGNVSDIRRSPKSISSSSTSSAINQQINQPIN